MIAGFGKYLKDTPVTISISMHDVYIEPIVLQTPSQSKATRAHD